MKLSRSAQTNTSGIYKIVNTLNGKLYVGSSLCIYNRFHQHRNKLRKNVHANLHLQNAYNKYKESSFEFIILELCDKEERFKKEQYYIDLLKPEYNKDLYVYPIVFTSEKRKAISDTLKEGYKTGRILSLSLKKIKVYNLNGDLLHTFNSLKETQLTLKIGMSSIRRCLSKRHKQVKGFQIRYHDDLEVGKIETYPHGATLRKETNIKIIITDLHTNKVYTFSKYSECCELLNIKYGSYVGCFLKSKTPIYRKRYDIKITSPIKTL